MILPPNNYYSRYIFVSQTVSVEYRSYFHCLLNSIWKIWENIPGIVKHISLYVQTFVFANNVIFFYVVLFFLSLLFYVA